MATESNPIETERSGKFPVSTITSKPDLIANINIYLSKNIDNSIYLYDTNQNPILPLSRINRLYFNQGEGRGTAWTTVDNSNFTDNNFIQFEGKELKQLLKDHYPSLDWTTGEEKTVESEQNTGGASRFGKKKKARTNKKKKRTTKRRKSKTNNKK